MKHITELTENEVIHCKTEEEWDGVCELGGIKFEHGKWGHFQENSFIRPALHSYGKIHYPYSDNDTIYPATLFLTPPVSLTRTIGEYALLQHDGKIYLIKGEQIMILTKEIIDHIKQM